MKSTRINNKCGRIKKFINGSAVIRLEGMKKDTKIPISLLKAPRGFHKLSLQKMREVLDSPHQGYKKGGKVCVTNEYPLFD